jgi:hypothetical protein
VDAYQQLCELRGSLSALETRYQWKLSLQGGRGFLTVAAVVPESRTSSAGAATKHG